MESQGGINQSVFKLDKEWKQMKIAESNKVLTPLWSRYLWRKKSVLTLLVNMNTIGLKEQSKNFQFSCQFHVLSPKLWP